MEERKPPFGRGRAILRSLAETRKAPDTQESQELKSSEATSSSLGRPALPQGTSEKPQEVPEEKASHFRRVFGRGRPVAQEVEQQVPQVPLDPPQLGSGKPLFPQGPPVPVEPVVPQDSFQHRRRPVAQEVEQQVPEVPLDPPQLGSGKPLFPQGPPVPVEPVVPQDSFQHRHFGRGRPLVPQITPEPVEPVVPQESFQHRHFGRGRPLVPQVTPEPAKVSEVPEERASQFPKSFGRVRPSFTPEQQQPVEPTGAGVETPPLTPRPIPSPQEGKYFIHGRGGGRGIELTLPPGTSLEPQGTARAGRVKPLSWPPAVEGPQPPEDAPSLPRICGRAKFRQHQYDTSPAPVSLAAPEKTPIVKDIPKSDPEVPEVDTKLSKVEEAVAPLVSKMSLRGTRQPQEDAPPVVMMGTSGQKINVVCNYIKFIVAPGKGVFLHEVIFEPEVDAKKFRFQLVKMLEDQLGMTRSFDGGSLLHLPHALERDVVANLKMPTDGSSVKVTVRFVRQFPFNSNEVIRLYNVLFRKIMVKLGLVLHGQNYFDPNHPTKVPAHKLELWPGFITAIQEYENGIMLNCDASYRALRTETVWQFLQDRAAHSDMQRAFQSSVCGLMVLTRYNNKIYRVDDIDLRRTPQSTFKRKDGSEISYMDYYKTQYDITINDVNQPLLKSQVKTRVKGEEVIGMVDLIPELCFLTGLNDEMRQDMRLMKDVASHTRISPAQRKKAMKEFLTNITTKPEAREVLENWGLRLDSDVIGIEARRLDPEDVHFGRGAVHRGNLNADWSRTACSSHVQCPIDLPNWYVFCTQRDSTKVQDFIDMAIKCGHQMGIDIKKPTVKTLSNDSTSNYISAIQNALKSNELIQIVVVVLPMARLDKYSAIKNICCINNPVPSQVILTRTISKPDKLRSVTQKIVLQMNCKVGGTLWSVNIPLKSAMIIGLDAYHDPTRKGSSVGAIVASFDSLYTRWYSQVFIQSPGQEVMNTLEESFLKCLGHYFKVNGALPETVVVYRDGVGDGQLRVCESYEIPQIIGAMRKYKPDYNPKFVFVVVQKRINTRIMAKDGTQIVNAQPGTVVDHTVTRRDLFDFFVVSQSVRQGTVTPTHYIVLQNSSQMKPDHIQRLSYKLSHLYYNWCGTVRVPAPCQYAHKLAFLIGEAVHGKPNNKLVDKLYFL